VKHSTSNCQLLGKQRKTLGVHFFWPHPVVINMQGRPLRA